MDLKDIVVHVDSTVASDIRLKVALSLAARFEAQLTGLHVIPDPEVPPYFKPSVVEKIAGIYEEHAREAAKVASLHFNRATQDSGIAVIWRCVEGNIARLLAEHARFADLLILGQADTENPPNMRAFPLPHDVVMNAGTPVLAIPVQTAVREVGRRVLLAWDGSREATRAFRDAMPLLLAADQIFLIAIDPSHQGHVRIGALVPYMVEHLARHNIHVEVATVRSGAENTIDLLLSHASQIGADLIVMGAFGHLRLKEFIIGGTTYDLLNRTTISVLMSH
jgi:nucleotide-binding universal stress UspA family protein